MLSQAPWNLFSLCGWWALAPTIVSTSMRTAPSAKEATVPRGAWDLHSPSLSPESLAKNQDEGKKHLSLASSGENSTVKFMLQSSPWDKAEASHHPKPFSCHSPSSLWPCFLHQFLHKSYALTISGSSSRELSVTYSPHSSHSDLIKMFTSFLCSKPSIGFPSHQEKKKIWSLYLSLKDSLWSSPANFLACSLSLSPSSIPYLQMLGNLLSQSCVLNFPPPGNLSPQVSMRHLHFFRVLGQMSLILL